MISYWFAVFDTQFPFINILKTIAFVFVCFSLCLPTVEESTRQTLAHSEPQGSKAEPGGWVGVERCL
jgi:hypothetical protein